MYKLGSAELLKIAELFKFVGICGIIFGVVMIFSGIKKGLSAANETREQENLERQKPIVEIQAKLISKTVLINNIKYELIFESEDGNRLNFAVQKNAAELLVEGDVGKLRYQGKLFNSFIRE